MIVLYHRCMDAELQHMRAADSTAWAQLDYRYDMYDTEPCYTMFIEGCVTFGLITNALDQIERNLQARVNIDWRARLENHGFLPRCTGEQKEASLRAALEDKQMHAALLRYDRIVHDAAGGAPVHFPCMA